MWKSRETNASFNQCCGTVTIYYGSGTDFRQVPLPVPVPAVYLNHKGSLRFGFIEKILRF
jgi:hypothetical protein